MTGLLRSQTKRAGSSLMLPHAYEYLRALPIALLPGGGTPNVVRLKSWHPTAKVSSLPVAPDVRPLHFGATCSLVGGDHRKSEANQVPPVTADDPPVVPRHPEHGGRGPRTLSRGVIHDVYHGDTENGTDTVLAPSDGFKSAVNTRLGHLLLRGGHMVVNAFHLVALTQITATHINSEHGELIL